MVSSGARSCLTVHLMQLRACGFMRLERGRGRSAGGGGGSEGGEGRGRLHDLYCVFSLTITTTYLVQEIIYAFKMRHDLDALAQVMFLLLCHVTSLVKQLVFYFDADRIDALVESLDDPLFNRPGPVVSRLLRARRTASSRLVRVYAGTALFTCMMWLAFPIYARATHRPVRFAVHVSLDYDSMLGFVVMLVYTNYVTALVGIANTSMDAFIATLLAQATTQINILKIFLSALTEDTVKMQKTTGESFYGAFKRLLTVNLEHYNKVLRLAESVQSIFGVATLVQFAIGGWILCMAAYKIVMLDGGVAEALSMMLFIVCILTELFLYCYYGNELTAASEGVSTSLYECGWERVGARDGGGGGGGGGGGAAQRLVLTGMTRARRSLAVTAARFVPLTLASYLTILKSSYTIFTVLRQTK